MNDDINKDLGIVTAYAYAVSKGYTGTEDDFAALMADYAEVGERAEAAATAAAASATAASGSASDSAASATAAAGSATAASTAAGNASQAATTATTKASEAAQSATAAAGSATTASTKASEAVQSALQAAGSATAAESAKTAAQTAQTAAETAQTAAETAQGAAEDAAESVSASAAQIAQNTADISSVKNALGATLITDTASGAIATFTDGADGVPMESVTVQMEPIQDLHGQDAPYPAGGGKNLLNLANGTGVAMRGVTPAYDGDGGLTFTGTTDSTGFAGNWTLNGGMTFSSGTYTVSIGQAIAYRLDILSGWTSVGYINAGATSGTFTISETTTVDKVVLSTTSGQSVSVNVKKIQIESGSTATAYAPYSNICPISGRSEVGVWRSGANLIDDTNWGGYSNEVTLGVGTWYAQCFIVSGDSNINTRLQYYNGETWISIYDSTEFPDSFSIDGSYRFGWTSGDREITITVNKPTKFRFDLYVMNATRRISISSTQLSSFVPYQTIQSVTIPLGQTVYGGMVDAVSGVMTVDRAMVALDARGAISWNKSSSYPGGFYFDTDVFVNYYYVAPRKNTPFLCSHAKTVDNISDYVNGTCYCDGSINIRIMSADTTVAQWVEYLVAQNTAGTPVEICCYLAQPITVQLTAQQLTSLLGTNNVWSDGGNVSVEYVADTKQYIAKVIAAALA